MEKSAIITIMVDNITYGELEELQEALEHILEDKDKKRITTNIQDDQLLPS